MKLNAMEMNAMELTDEMIEAGAEYLCGYSKEKAIRLEEEENFYACCRQAEELFNVMQAVAKTSDSLQSADLQRELAEAAPVNNNPHMW